MDLARLKRRILLSLVLGFAVILALGVYSDFRKIVSSFMHFDVRYIPLILLLAPSNYFFRYLKWSYYCRLLGIKVRRSDNLRIFLSGLCMTVTPGKLGEFLKSYLVKELYGIPISVTSPLIVIERMTDGISMMLLAGIGAMQFQYGFGVLVVSAFLVAVFVASVRIRPFAKAIIGLLKKIPVLSKLGGSMDTFYKSTYDLLGIRSIMISVFIGLLSWSLEGIVIFLVLLAFGTPVSLLTSIFILSFSSIAGAVSMLPGGLFITEGSILGLLLLAGVRREIASAVTIITRFATLWLGVGVGILFLASILRLLEKKSQSNAGKSLH